MNLVLKGLSVLDSFRQSLLIFYLKELSLADEKEEFKKFYNAQVEGMLQSLLSFDETNKEDIIQILQYGNQLQTSMKVA